MVFVTGAWGLGENIVQGSVDPDEFYVHKPTFRAGHRCVLRRSLGGKQRQLVYGEGGGAGRRPYVDTPADDRERFCISDAEVLTLADYAHAHRGSLLPPRRRTPADGHRMGQGRPRRRALHRPGAA